MWISNRKVDFLGSFALVLVFLSFLVLGLKGSALCFDVPGLLAIVANARIIRFASVPRVGQSVRGTSTTVTWLVDRALHGAGFTRGLLR